VPVVHPPTPWAPAGDGGEGHQLARDTNGEHDDGREEREPRASRPDLVPSGKREDPEHQQREYEVKNSFDGERPSGTDTREDRSGIVVLHEEGVPHQQAGTGCERSSFELVTDQRGSH
jgi:hypothetical protein